jgi:hypothetical protein
MENRPSRNLKKDKGEVRLDGKPSFRVRVAFITKRSLLAEGYAHAKED